MTMTINLKKILEPREPDALSLAVMLATAELTNIYNDEETLGSALEIFLDGYQSFVETKLTPHVAYMTLRWLYCATDGEFQDFVSDYIKKFHPPYKLTTMKGILGELGDRDLGEIVEKLTKDGYYIFNQKLSTEICEKLKSFALITPSNPYPTSSYNQKIVYDIMNLLAPTYKFDEIDLLNNPEIQRLVADPSILAVAQSYLGCKPIQDLVAMWWSTTFSKEANSAAAQLYHFDMDRIKFIKFFIYLTEVTPQNGPHCYIRGSHQTKPLQLLKDGRIPDSEIEQYYSKEDIVEITGSPGTIIAADTRGFHKGKPLQSGERLVLQFEFANSLFGAPYNMFRLEQISKKFLDSVSLCRYTYCRFT